MNFLDERDINGNQPGIAEADEEAEDGHEDPAALIGGEGHDAGGEREVEGGGDEHLALSASQPQKKAPGTAPRPEESRITAD